jgi:hypothetical protein
MRINKPGSSAPAAREALNDWEGPADEFLSAPTAVPTFMFRGHDPKGAWRWAAPKEFLTGALLRAQKRGREFLINEAIPTNSNVRLVVTGESLFQYDGCVFMLVAHEGRNGDPISFRIRDFVVELRGEGKGKKTRGAAPAGRPIDSVGGASLVSVLQSIIRLTGFHVDLSVYDKAGSLEYGYRGNLIDEATISIDGVRTPLNDDLAARPDISEMVLHVTLNPKMSSLFEKTRCVFFIPSMRRKFSTSPLTLWLYGFVRANSQPFDLPLSYFREKSGSTSEPAEFSRLMTQARKRLRAAKVIYSSRMDEGRLHFVRKKPVKPPKTAASKDPGVNPASAVQPAGVGRDISDNAPDPWQQGCFEFDG